MILFTLITNLKKSHANQPIAFITRNVVRELVGCEISNF